jgi:hypothetical protein
VGCRRYPSLLRPPLQQGEKNGASAKTWHGGVRRCVPTAERRGRRSVPRSPAANEESRREGRAAAAAWAKATDGGRRRKARRGQRGGGGESRRVRGVNWVGGFFWWVADFRAAVLNF